MEEAMEASRKEAKADPHRNLSSTGAGPSRTKPSDTKTEKYIRVPVKKTVDDYLEDSRRVEFGLPSNIQLIPLPRERMIGMESNNFVTIARPSPSSNGYPNTWFSILDMADSLPTNFRRVSRDVFTPSELRTVTSGYQIFRRIRAAAHWNSDSRNIRTAFLYTLAAWAREVQLTEQMHLTMGGFAQQMGLTAQDDFHTAQTFEALLHERNDESFGVTFTIPDNPNAPYTITTPFSITSFTAIIRAMNMDYRSIRSLIAYADMMVRTRITSNIDPLIARDSPQSRIHSAPFVEAGPTYTAFTDFTSDNPIEESDTPAPNQPPAVPSPNKPEGEDTPMKE